MFSACLATSRLACLGHSGVEPLRIALIRLVPSNPSFRKHMRLRSSVFLSTENLAQQIGLAGISANRNGGDFRQA